VYYWTNHLVVVLLVCFHSNRNLFFHDSQQLNIVYDTVLLADAEKAANQITLAQITTTKFSYPSTHITVTFLKNFHNYKKKMFKTKCKVLKHVVFNLFFKKLNIFFLIHLEYLQNLFLVCLLDLPYCHLYQHNMKYNQKC
jgi:hypothetical protein